MKMSGAEFRAFMNDRTIWPEGLIVEDEIISINGVESDLPSDDDYADTDLINIMYGSLRWEDNREHEPGALTSLARRWAKSQKEVRLLVTVPKDKLEELTLLLKSIGAKIG